VLLIGKDDGTVIAYDLLNPEKTLLEYKFEGIGRIIEVFFIAGECGVIFVTTADKAVH